MDFKASDRSQGQSAKRQKRARAVLACERCREKKNRCDELYPCSYCVAHAAECVYRKANFARRPFNPGRKLEDLEREIQEMKAALESKRPDFENDGAALNSARFLKDVTSATSHEYSLAQSVSETLESKEQLTTPTAQASAASEIYGDRGRNGEVAGELTATNSYTRNPEFYGGSSSVAFLRQVHASCDDQTKVLDAGASRSSLISMLHNTAFTPSSPRKNDTLQADGPVNLDRFYFRVSREFIDGCFDSIHLIQPILDKEEFVTRCENLWFNQSHNESESFYALYYSVLSIGALVRVWDEGLLYGLGRFQWSRRLFDEARQIISTLNVATNLDMVQCLFLMAKVCQHELNPHMTYMDVGKSVRTALAIGLNRQPSQSSREDAAYSRAAWRTWWNLYTLDCQTSFALGRADSLGADDYHNRRFPQTLDQVGHDIYGIGVPDSSELAIIPAAVEMARITRRISLEIYLPKSTFSKKLPAAKQIEIDLDHWLAGLPDQLRAPLQPLQVKPLNPLRLAKHCQRQQLVLFLRYHNTRMILNGFFLGAHTSAQKLGDTSFAESSRKCVEAATRTIEAIHDTYCRDEYFQSWWYNSTYILFAATVLLICIFQNELESPEGALFRTVEKSIEVLEAMDQSVVTKNATDIIRRASARARDFLSASMFDSIPLRTDAVCDGPESGGEFDQRAFHFDVAGLDDTQMLFWTEWGNSLEIFGTGP